MITTKADETAISASFDWIYGHINEIRRDLKRRVNGGPIGIKIISIHWVTKDLSKLITDYWVNNANNEPKIRECIESIFSTFDELGAWGYMFVESDKLGHKQRLLNIVDERRSP